jgi:hypothetical protein
MADTYSAASPFIDKEADQADLDRKNKIDLATIGAVSKAMGSAGAGGSASPFGGASLGPAPATTGPTPQQMGVGSPAAAPAAPASPFDSFQAFLRESDPSLQALKTKAVAGVQQQFDNPAAAFDQGAAISREDLGKTIQSARDSQREDLIKTYGPNASQVMPAINNFDQNAILQTRDLDRRLAADRATASQTGLNQAIANAMGITGQSSQERQAAAGLTLNAAQAGEQSRQFEKSLATQVTEASLGRAFTSQERQAVQDFQNAQRMGAQDFASAEAALGRTFSTGERLAIQEFQKSERLSVQDFQSILTEKGYAHDSQMEIMRDNLQRELQDKGLAADVAKQQADQKFQEMVQQRDQAFNATQAEIGRKWTSGERIESQEYQKGIQANEFKQQDALAQLQTLTQKQIAQGSWDNASKLQAEQLLATAADAEKTRSQQYLMFSAQQAQEDSHFAQEFGLKQEEVRAAAETTKAQLGIALKQLGIAEDQWNTQKNDAAFNKALELAEYGVQMWNGDNEAALEPFASKLASILGQGLGMDPEKMQLAIKSTFQESGGQVGAVGSNTKESFANFDKTVDSMAGASTPEAREALKTLSKTMANAYAAVPAGKVVSLNTGSGSDFDAAIARLKTLGKTSFEGIVSRDRVSGLFTSHYEYQGTPEFANYTIYSKLLSNGLSAADAKAALTSLLGSKEKAEAAINLEAK